MKKAGSGAQKPLVRSRGRKLRSSKDDKISKDLKHLIELSWCERRKVFLAAIPDFGIVSWGETYEEALQMLAKASTLTIELFKIYKNAVPKPIHRPQWLRKVKAP